MLSWRDGSGLDLGSVVSGQEINPDPYAISLGNTAGLGKSPRL